MATVRGTMQLSEPHRMMHLPASPGGTGEEDSVVVFHRNRGTLPMSGEQPAWKDRRYRYRGVRASPGALCHHHHFTSSLRHHHCFQAGHLESLTKVVPATSMDTLQRPMHQKHQSGARSHGGLGQTRHSTPGRVDQTGPLGRTRRRTEELRTGMTAVHGETGSGNRTGRATGSAVFAGAPTRTSIPRPFLPSRQGRPAGPSSSSTSPRPSARRLS